MKTEKKMRSIRIRDIGDSHSAFVVNFQHPQYIGEWDGFFKRTGYDDFCITVFNAVIFNEDAYFEKKEIEVDGRALRHFQFCNEPEACDISPE